MPTKTRKQHNLMCAAAHNKGMAKKHGMSQSIAKEFCDADKKAGKFKGKGKK